MFGSRANAFDAVDRSTAPPENIRPTKTTDFDSDCVKFEEIEIEHSKRIIARSANP